MASWKRVGVFLGLVIILFFITLSFNQIGTPQKKIEPIHTRQIRRQQQLRQTCDSLQRKWNYNIDHLSNGDLANFLYDDEHRIIYCYIPKVACTNWKRLLFALRHGMPADYDLTSLDHDSIHDHKAIPCLKEIPKREVKEKLKHYKKFLFVRDPFVRLISAYRDKIHNSRQPHFQGYSWLILNQYGNQTNKPKTKEEAIASEIYPTFYNFIQFLIDSKTAQPLDEHWRPMYQLCHPCLIQYDFIGHQETLQEDAEQLLKMLKLENYFKFPSAYINATTRESLFKWYKPALTEDRRKLYQLYEMDFNLFGYSKPVELLDS
ncbi:carbohydrate sulfotransferase 12-like [Brachionichthys hirsutus]|uniref:carbohydrate sulfotransferase 12-like n=1 Tax=Brachionichthys hirsutus TaxID=412623 RepID=UPI0036049A62